MGYALLLQWSGIMGMVLQLSLCTSHFRYDSFLYMNVDSWNLMSWILIDLRKVDEMSFDFQLGIPFRPYEQLMGVLPVASMEQIPPAYQVCLVSAKTLCLLLVSHPLR